MERPPDELKAGALLAGKYEIAGTIGTGGMGVVYRATHRRLSQEVAIKMLLPSMLGHEAVVARFEREARAAGQLRSRHTVRVIDVGEEAGHGPYMVMEYLHGHDLGTELEQRGPLPVGAAVDWVLQACAAMAEAHERGIVHRDLKPSNLFLATEGEDRILKVLDFGISKVEDADGSSVTNTSVTMGTPLYMSPEQVRSTKNVDARTDIWSLGIILYELLTGKTPFEGAPAAVGAAIVSDDVPRVDTLRADVPAELADVVERALAKKRDDRYPNVRAFSAALAPWSERPAPTSSARVTASDPKIQTRGIEEERAPTMALGLEPDVKVGPTTSIEWTTGHSAPRKSRAPLLVAAIALLTLAGLGGAIALSSSAGRRHADPEPAASSATNVPAHVVTHEPTAEPRSSAVPGANAPSASAAVIAPTRSARPTLAAPPPSHAPPAPAPRPTPSAKPPTTRDVENPNRL